MINLIEQLKQVLDVLASKGIEYAICGGIAVNIYGHVRTTKDIDLLVQEQDIESIYNALEEIGFIFRAGPIPFKSRTEKRQILYRISRRENGSLLTVDLMVVTPILEDVWASRQKFEWQDREIYVVSLEGLTKMKLLGSRHQDLADLENLGVEFELEANASENKEK